MDDNDLLLLHDLTSQHYLEIDEERELGQQVHLLTAVLIIGSNEDHKGIDGTTCLTPAATVPGVPQVESSDHKTYGVTIPKTRYAPVFH